MKKITLKTLSYHGFRGQTQEITFSDKTTAIRGRNGSGKSTVLNAILWLLLNVDTEDRNNFNLFDNNEDYTPENVGRCDVTATFDVDGVPLKLAKNAMQVWRRNRATGEQERANDTYEYYVDDLAVPATKYTSTIDGIFGKGGNKLKLMMNIHYYQGLEWKELRKHFASIVGDITDTDFEGDYSEVLPLIQKSGAEDARKTFMNRLNELSKTEAKQEAAIKAQQEQLPDISDLPQIEAQIATLKKEREGIEQMKQALVGQNDALVKRRKEEEDVIAEKRAELQKARLEHDASNKARLAELEQAVTNAKRTNRSLTQQRDVVRQSIANAKMLKDTNEARLVELRTENMKIKSRMFENVCPNCGHEFTGARYTEELQRFNAKKEGDLAANISEGKATRTRVEQFIEQVAQLEAQLAAIKAVAVEPLEAELDTFCKAMRPYDGSALEAEIATLEATKTVIPENPDMTAYQSRTGEICTELERLYRELGKKDSYDKGMRLIAQRQAEKKQTSQDIATNTKMKTLVEAYQREYADIIRKRVNVNFDKVQVVMTKVNKSGDIVDTCEFVLDNVSGGTINNANQYLIGYEIAQAFQKYYDVCLPLFIDNAESINECNLPQYDGQRVLLCVDDCEFTIN